MSNLTSYLIFWIVIYLILSIFWYILDRTWGQKFYRFFYRLTHRSPLPEDIQRGFIFNRRTKHQALMATIISTIQTVLVVSSISEPNLLVELILWLVEVPTMLVGFALGPWAYKLWTRKNEVFDAMDDLGNERKKLFSWKKNKSFSKQETEENESNTEPLNNDPFKENVETKEVNTNKSTEKKLTPKEQMNKFINR